MSDTSLATGRSQSSILGAPLTNSLIFFALVVAGCAYIITAKLEGVEVLWVTFGPVAVMLFYALLVGVVRPLRLRDDQTGDNLYYMGFLFTLTSLGVSLYQFDAEGAAESIVQNFGVAIASTIAGIALRVFFNQMRRDPIEVEASSRLELALAARRVRREMDSTVLEFGHFRRATQQMVADALAETADRSREFSVQVLESLRKVAHQSRTSLSEVTEDSRELVEMMADRVAAHVNTSASLIEQSGTQFSDSARALAEAVQVIAQRLKDMPPSSKTVETELHASVHKLTEAVQDLKVQIEAHHQSIARSAEAAAQGRHAEAHLAGRIDALIGLLQPEGSPRRLSMPAGGQPRE